jgi:phosphatidylglycerol:prolipoprotein diacylglycerol transferase
MYPTFLRINPIVVVATYGMSLMLALAVSYSITRNEAKRCHQNPELYTELYFYGLIAAIIGSRLFYVLIDPGLLLHDRLAVLKIWQGGLVFYGGLICALVTVVYYLKHNGLPVSKTLDIMAPGIAMGQTIGYLGCLFSGCLHGRPCDYPWAVTFQNPDTMAFWGVPVHPTQLYAAILSLAIFAFIWRRRLEKRFDGELFWLYVIVDGTSRLIVDHWRGDFRGSLLGGFFSVSQILGSMLICLAVIMLIKLKQT